MAVLPDTTAGNPLEPDASTETSSQVGTHSPPHVSSSAIADVTSPSPDRAQTAVEHADDRSSGSPYIERSLSSSTPTSATGIGTLNVPSGSSRWVWLTVVASIGLHAILLFAPTSTQPKPQPSKSPAEQVRITQLPSQLRKVKVAQPKLKKVLPKVKKPVDRPQPALPPPKPQPTKPESESANTPSDANPWDDFPLFPDSRPGCFELQSCLQTDADLTPVVEYFTKELPLKKYQIKPVSQDASRAVFQVSKSKLTQFLSLITTEKGTVYVLSDAPRSLEDLKKAVEVPQEIYSILGNLAAQEADPSLFAQPDLFYTKAGDKQKTLAPDALVPRPPIKNISLVPDYSADTMMDEFFRNNLQINDFEITDLPQTYGGGKVYLLKKEKLTLYLNLVPTKDGTGTLIVSWKTPPG